MDTKQNFENDKNYFMKSQVVSEITGKCFFTGTSDECQNWIINYGLGNTQFGILPFDGHREYGCISETY